MAPTYSNYTKSEASSSKSSPGSNAYPGIVGGDHSHRSDILSCIDVTPSDGLRSVSTHVVLKGETLFTIARDFLGNQKLWQWLAVMNGLEPTAPIFAGMTLKLHPLAPDWKPIVKLPPANDCQALGPVASWPAKKAAENVCPAVLMFLLGRSSGKIDLDEGLQELFRPFEFEVGLGAFIARIRLKGSLKVTRSGVVSNGLTFSQLGLEAETAAVRDGILKDISGTVKLRYEAFSKKEQALQLKLGDKITFDKAEFAFEYDFAENAAVFTANAKVFKYKNELGDVEGKLGVEIRVKKRDKSLPGDGEDFVPATEEFEASVAATAAVLIPVAIILAPVVAAAAEVDLAATGFATAARSLAVQLPKLIAVAPTLVLTK